MEKSKNFQIIKYDNETGASEVKDVISVEHAVDIYVNGKLLAKLACTPQRFEELATGHLYSSGLIRAAGDVKEITLSQDLRTIRVTADLIEPAPTPAANGFRIPIASILKNSETFLKRNQTSQETGMLHSCALFIDEELAYLGEDIGRHNAIDKTLGIALREGVSFENIAAITTGRIPGDITTKFINARVPVIISRSAPTDVSIDLARRYNITLCGFARGRRLNIYANEQRVVI